MPEQNMPKLSKIATVQQRKPRFRDKIKSVVLSVDTPDLKKSIVEGVIKPGIKNLIFDSFKNVGTAITDTVGTVIYGEDYKKKKKRKQGNGILTYWSGYNYPSASQTGYISATGQAQSISKAQPSPKASWAFDEYGFATEMDARMVLDALEERIDTYGKARACDFFDAVDVSWDYTAQSWGWTDLTTAKVSYVGGECPWVIELPPVVPMR